MVGLNPAADQRWRRCLRAILQRPMSDMLCLCRGGAEAAVGEAGEPSATRARRRSTAAASASTISPLPAAVPIGDAGAANCRRAAIGSAEGAAVGCSGRGHAGAWAAAAGPAAVAVALDEPLFGLHAQALLGVLALPCAAQLTLEQPLGARLGARGPGESGSMRASRGRRC